MQWEIIDETGVIFSGTEEQMREGYRVMTAEPSDVSEQDENDYIDYLQTGWYGDLKLVEVHKIYRNDS